MEDSYVKLYRSLLGWRWFRDPSVAHLFVYLLLRANYVDADWHAITIKRGQLVTSRFSLAENTGLTEKVIRRSLKALQKTGEIIVESGEKKYSLITVVKYSEYQGGISKMVQARAKQRPSEAKDEATSEENEESEKNDSSRCSESMSDVCPTNRSDVIEGYDAFVAYFNEAVAGTAIQRIRVISNPRKRLLDARCKEYGKDAIAEVIKKAVASAFLNGSASEKFVATFDWLIRPRNFLKVLEGNYDNRKYINAKNMHNYGTDSYNGYRSREDIISGAANIVRELREEALQPKEELPVV